MSLDEKRSKTSATVYLFRHGKIKYEGDFDTLNSSGEEFRDSLPSFFSEKNIDTVFFNSSVRRCSATVFSLPYEKIGYSVSSPIRTINSVLGHIETGQHAICCKGESIESGQLYHVKKFELHVPFGGRDHGKTAKLALANTYHTIYVLEKRDGFWTQTNKFIL